MSLRLVEGNRVDPDAVIEIEYDDAVILQDTRNLWRAAQIVLGVAALLVLGLALLSMRVLRIIESHPEGVRALDIGNELGVDWRLVLVAARSLADAGLAQQVDQNFYAIPKGSRTW